MKTPIEILERFENASSELVYGEVTLTLSVKQGKQRYIIAREESFLLEEASDKTALFSTEVIGTDYQ